PPRRPSDLAAPTATPSTRCHPLPSPVKKSATRARPDRTEAKTGASRGAGPSSATPAPPRGWAWVNGRVVRADRASISVFDRGLVLGDGLFETLRARDGKPEFLTLHYRRMTRSARRLRIAV